MKYNGKHVPTKFCPTHHIPLIVNEKEYKTVNPDAPYYERRLTCPAWFTDGCRYKEPFTEEVQALLDAPVLVSEEVEF
jgi:hypothetical protein